MSTLNFGDFITVPISSATWFGDDRTPAPPNVADAIMGLANQLFPVPGPTGDPGNGLRNFDQCGEIPLTRLLAALRDPNAPLSDVQTRINLSLDPVDPAPPGPPQDPRCPVFVSHRGTTVNPLHLEIIHQAINAVRAIQPSWNPPAASIPVIFCDLGRVRGMTAPDNPVFINMRLWNAGSLNFKKALIAHELFHHAQYASNFRSASPGPRYAWFSEGTASWAEHACNAALTNPQKLLATSSHPTIGLLNSSYYAFPFWLKFFSQSGSMATFLSGYSILTNAEKVADVPPGHIGSVNTQSLVDRLGNPFTNVLVTDQTAGDTKPAVVFRPKTLKFPTGSHLMRTSGSLPRYGSELYDFNSGPNGLSVQVNSGVTLSILVPKGPGYQVHTGAPKNLNPPFRIVVTGPSVGPELSPFQLDVGTDGTLPPPADPVPAKPASVIINSSSATEIGLDAFGNVLIANGDNSGVVGFRVDAYSSISNDDPNIPADLLSWFVPGVPDPITKSVTVTLAGGYSASFTSIHRKVTALPTALPGGAVVWQLEIETAITGGKAGSFESIILTGVPEAIESRYLSMDGGETAPCLKHSTDCDGETRPLWFRGFGGPNAPAVNPIVPFSGKAYLPAPSPLATSVIEHHEVPF